ncbi:uncharacterized protein METZ01_LOCUS468897, partial [marine metagenome]
MISIAKSSGADAIKFQTAVPEEVVTKSTGKAEYQKKTTDKLETQLNMLQKIHLPLKDYKILKKKSEALEIEFLSAPFDITSVNLLSKIGLNKFKIPSGEINNFPYLQLIGKQNKP